MLCKYKSAFLRHRRAARLTVYRTPAILIPTDGNKNWVTTGTEPYWLEDTKKPHLIRFHQLLAEVTAKWATLTYKITISPDRTPRATKAVEAQTHKRKNEQTNQHQEQACICDVKITSNQTASTFTELRYCPDNIVPNLFVSLEAQKLKQSQQLRFRHSLNQNNLRIWRNNSQIEGEGFSVRGLSGTTGGLGSRS